MLWVVLGALVLAAVIGVGAVLTGTRLDWKVVASLFSVALFGVTSLGASVVAARDGVGKAWMAMMRAAWVISGVGLLFYLSVILLEPSYSRRIVEWMLVTAIWAVTLPLAGLLGLTRFSGGWRWTRWGTLGVVFALAGYLSLATWDVVSDSTWQVGAVLGILAGLGVIGLPVLQRLYGVKEERKLTAAAMEMEGRCPRCGEGVRLGNGNSACGKCGLKFELLIEEPRCKGCGYLIYGLATRCPECGKAIGIA